MSWERHELQKLILPIKGALVSGPFGSSIGSRFFVDEGIPVIRGNNLTKSGAKFIDDGFAFLTDEKAAEFSNCIAVSDDIIFTAAGSIGQVGIIPQETRFAHYIISNKQIRARLDKEKVEPMFVYYWLSSSTMTQYLENMNNGGAVPLLNLGIIRRVPVPVPPLPAQQKIVEILSAYDDLIENNRRRIDLLEQSARMLYKEWFVSLRFPGHEHVQVKDGVPQGWEDGKVADFYSTTSGGTPSRKNPSFYEGEINWVKTQELLDGFIFSTDEKITEDAIEQSSAKVFPSETVLVAMYGATIGQLGILATPAASNQACCALIPSDNGANYVFAFLFFRENKEILKGLSQGAAQNNINQQIIREFRMVMPSAPIMEAFLEYAKPILEQIKILQLQVSQLTKARDLLLPRLMNGEISV